jgi:O-antigen ligase
MYKFITHKISQKSVFVSIYLFALLFLALYGRQGFQALNQIILWGFGPVVAFYILEPNIGKFNTVPKEYYLYMALVVFAFLGYANVQNDEKFFRYVQVILANFVLMITVYFAINNIKEWLLIWKIIWIVGLTVCVLSFSAEPTQVNDEYFRLEGLAGNSNGTANYARVAIIAALMIMQFQKDRLVKIMYWVSIIFLSYIIIITASRGAFGNLVFVVGGYFVLKYFSGWRMILLLFLLFVFGNLILFAAESFLSEFFLYRRLTRNETVAGAIEEEGRLQLYVTAWKYFLENPLLGVGLNQFRYVSDGHISHTDILDVFVQLGAFGGACYVAIYVRLFRKIRRLNKWIASIEDKHMYQLILLCFFSELFFGLANPNWFTQLEMVVLSLLLIYTTKIKKVSLAQKNAVA